MSKHSPGPWQYPEAARSPARLLAADGDCIAMVYLTNPSTRKRDDAHARNAAMLRAAPELLAFVIAAGAYDDTDAGGHLAKRGTYARFDNPDTVEAARELLKRLGLEP